MPSRIVRSCLPALVAVVLSTLVCEGALGALLPIGGPWVAWTTTAGDELMLHHIRAGITKSVAAETPANVEVSGSYVKYETVPGAAFGLTLLGVEDRVKIYDALSDTQITVGENPTLAYYSDSKSVLSDQYVVYDRSYNKPEIRDWVTNSVTIPVVNLSGNIPSSDLIRSKNFLSLETELHLFDIETLADIVITEGSGINGIQIDDSTIVWQMLDKSAPDFRDWDTEIFAYDMRSGIVRQVTDNDVDDRAPQISGDNIVWTTTVANGETEIYYETTGFSVGGRLLGGISHELIDLTEATFLPAQVAVVAIPEPASLVLMSLTTLAALGRRRASRRA